MLGIFLPNAVAEDIETQKAISIIKNKYDRFDADKIKEYLVELNRTNPDKANALNNPDGWEEIWITKFQTIDNTFIDKYNYNLSSNLPKNINDGFSINKVQRHKNTIYILVKRNAIFSQMDMIKVQNELDKGLCDNKTFSMMLLKKGYLYTVMYQDYKDTKVGGVQLSYKDCINHNLQKKYSDFIKTLNKEEKKEFNPTIEPFINIYYDLTN